MKNALVDKSQVQIVVGEDLINAWIIKDTTSGKEKHKLFCKQCGCILWTIPMVLNGEKLVVRTSLLDKG